MNTSQQIITRTETPKPLSTSTTIKMNTSSRNTVLAIIASLATISPIAARAGAFVDDFSTGLNPTFWSVSQTTPNLYSLDATQGDVRLAKTGNNPGGFQDIEIDLNLGALGGAVSGDFAAQIQFANAVIGPNVDQVEFHTRFADSSIFLDVYDPSGGGTNVHVWDGLSIQGRTPVASTAGIFEISRSGSTVTGKFNGTPIFSQTHAAALRNR